MRHRHGKWFADWRDETGRRQTKALCTIAEALLWKETHRRKIQRLTEEQKKLKKRRIDLLSKNRCDLRRIWLTVSHGRRRPQPYYTDSIIGTAHLRNPTFRFVEPNGRLRIEKWEPPEKLIARLGLQR